MKNYEVLIVIFAGLGIAYYVAKKTTSATGPIQQPLGNVKIASVQSPSGAFPTVPPCCVGLGGVKIQPTTMIPELGCLVPPECIA